MATIVQKYGGTSLAGPDEIKNVARRIVKTAEAGNRVCAVVSAMGHSTDELIDLAALVSSDPHPRELDMLLTSGERISMALVSMAINDLGHEAASFTGSQAGIVTDTSHGRARIVEMRRGRVHEALDRGQIAIVAGFQGVSTTRDVTTLGRGGSDTTAVALAAALHAEVCEIYTDVDGVYSADPRIVPDARKLKQVSFEEMLDLAAAGARVLALRSVEYARNHGVKIHVRSSFNDTEGTWILREEDMEQAIISGIAHDTSEAKVTIRRVPDRPGVAGRTFRPLADAGINVGEIVQNTSLDGLADISFTLPEDELDPGRADPGAALARDRGRGLHLGARHRQGLGDRRRDEDQPGRRRRDLRGARRRRDQHRDHLDLVDPRLVRRSGERVRPRGERDPRAAAARGRVLRSGADVD